MYLNLARRARSRRDKAGAAEHRCGKARTYVHGISYVDERLMMKSETLSRPYYYALDRMYNVVMLIDRAGAIVERYCYDAYGRPYTCP